MGNRRTGFLALLMTSFLFGSYGLWIRILSSGLNTYQQIALRYLLGGLFLFLIIRIKKERISLQNVSKIQLGLFSLAIPVFPCLF